MPIIRISTNIDDADVRGRIAGAIAECFLATGVTPSHVSTIFTSSSADDLYLAGEPLSSSAGDVGYALVQVGMSAARSDDFRADLAVAITAAFADVAEPTRISIDFIAREGVDSYIGGRALGRRSASAPLERTGATLTAPQIRSALRELDWGDDVLTATEDVLLVSLAPEWLGDWDSLSAIDTSQGVAEVLQLPPNVFDTGQQDYADALGRQATLGSFIAFVIGAAA